MKVPFALTNIIGGKVRTIVAVTGVSFAMVMVFLQLGFFGGMVKSSTGIYDKLDYDIVFLSNNYLRFITPGSFNSSYIYQAMSVPGVKSVSPLYLRRFQWTNPDNGQKEAAIAIGFNPKDSVFLIPEINRYLDKITKLDTVLYDKLSQKKCGNIHIGTETELNNRKIKVVGSYSLGAGFVASGTIIISDQNFIRIFPDKKLENVNIGLIKIEKNFKAEDIVINLRQQTMGKVKVLTKDEIRNVEIDFWIRSTNTGLILSSGVVVAICIGIVILYQVLANDITNRLPEYATLKAMGYGKWYLSSIVIQQAVIIAALGFIPASVFSLFLYAFIRNATNLYIYMTFGRICLVFLLNIVMCSLSALIALRKVEQADPADLF